MPPQEKGVSQFVDQGSDRIGPLGWRRVVVPQDDVDAQGATLVIQACDLGSGGGMHLQVRKMNEPDTPVGRRIEGEPGAGFSEVPPIHGFCQALGQIDFSVDGGAYPDRNGISWPVANC